MTTLALAWGFAEATLFFIVPDVLVSFTALESRTRGIRVSLWAALAATIGGAAMYAWAAHDAETVMVLLDRIPAISAGMIENVRSQLAGRGLDYVFIGGVTGKPFKIHASWAGQQQIPIHLFLPVAFLARFARFGCVALLASGIGGLLKPRWDRRRRRMLLAAFWVLFYAAYLSLMPN